MSKPDPPGPHLEGGQSWGDAILSPNQVPNPALEIETETSDDSQNNTMITVQERPETSTVETEFITVQRKSKRKKPSTSPLQATNHRGHYQTTQPFLIHSPTQQTTEKYIHDGTVIRLIPKSQETLFLPKNIQQIRLTLFKALRCSFSINIARDGSLEVLFPEANHANTALQLTTVGSIQVTTEKWKPQQKEEKIVVYNIPPEIPEAELKEGLMTANGEDIPVKAIHRLGKPGINTPQTSRTVLFILDGHPQITQQIFLFGQPKAHKAYKDKPIQCKKCHRLGHTYKHCKTTINKCIVCQEEHESNDCKAQPKCINCNGPHHSDNRRLCPKYRERLNIIRMAEIKNIPIPFAAQQVSKYNKPAIPSETVPNTPLSPTYSMLETPWTPRTSSTPQKSPIPARFSSLFPAPASTSSSNSNRQVRPTSLPGIKQNPKPLAPVASATNQATESMPTNTAKAITNLIAYTMASTFLSQAKMPQGLKAVIMRELATKYFSKSLVETAELDLITILNNHQAYHYMANA